MTEKQNQSPHYTADRDPNFYSTVFNNPWFLVPLYTVMMLGAIIIAYGMIVPNSIVESDTVGKRVVGILVAGGMLAGAYLLWRILYVTLSNVFTSMVELHETEMVCYRTVSSRAIRVPYTSIERIFVQCYGNGPPSPVLCGEFPDRRVMFSTTIVDFGEMFDRILEKCENVCYLEPDPENRLDTKLERFINPLLMVRNLTFEDFWKSSYTLTAYGQWGQVINPQLIEKVKQRAAENRKKLEGRNRE